MGNFFHVVIIVAIPIISRALPLAGPALPEPD
jgi:hypothetical protein